MKQNEHGRLIAAAAKAHLLPLGCRRKGQSRVWFADQGFWQIGIEFQPSGWSRGSYLNVGGQWLWKPKPHFSFETGYRVENFVSFEDAKSFAEAADRLAALAAAEVLTLRDRFRSWAGITAFLAKPPHHRYPWFDHDVAIAAGLAGDFAKAVALWDQMLAEPPGDERQQRRQIIAMQLRASLDDAALFRGIVTGLVDECRVLQRMASHGYCQDAGWLELGQP